MNCVKFEFYWKFNLLQGLFNTLDINFKKNNNLFTLLYNYNS